MNKRSAAGILKFLNHIHHGDVIEHHEYGEITIIEILSFKRNEGEESGYRVRARVASADGRERVVPLRIKTR